MRCDFFFKQSHWQIILMQCATSTRTKQGGTFADTLPTFAPPGHLNSHPLPEHPDIRRYGQTCHLVSVVSSPLSQLHQNSQWGWPN
ncbi:hypothetical protein AMELA_G00267280 [Ameiurus melas]|uniref:Uncharacterized protein n=1 Tax=Ameiurus melas TaxID=219545 RepID=A0A7J5ZPH5_AMEME|nr:hypothetical protein AMELA_G00267280 [Ameiurus melas]